jgi:hypothetical protein
MGGTCSTHGRNENVYKVLVEKLEAKIQLWVPRHRWENNIKMYFEGISCEDMDWIHLGP